MLNTNKTKRQQL